MSSMLPNFKDVSNSNQLKTMLCPTSSGATKIINMFIRIMFLARDYITDAEDLSYPTMPVNIDSTDYDNFSDIDEWEDFESFLSDSDLDHG